MWITKYNKLVKFDGDDQDPFTFSSDLQSSSRTSEYDNELTELNTSTSDVTIHDNYFYESLPMEGDLSLSPMPQLEKNSNHEQDVLLSSSFSSSSDNFIDSVLLQTGENSVSCENQYEERLTERQPLFSSAPIPPLNSFSLGFSFQLPFFNPIKTISSGRFNFQNNDGVFSNLSAKPEVKRPPLPGLHEFQTLEPAPSYQERELYDERNTEVVELPEYEDIPLIQSELQNYSNNPGLDIWIEKTFYEVLYYENDMKVDNILVGPVGHLFISMLLCGWFQWFGFVLCYLFYSSHAFKNGAIAGLGVTFFQTGYVLSSRVLDYQLGIYSSVTDQFVINPSSGTWFIILSIIGYLSMAVGWILIIYATEAYLRLIILRHKQNLTTPSHIAAPLH